MKKNKKTVMSIVAIAIIGLATLIIYSCQKERKFKMYDGEDANAGQIDHPTPI
jgi:ABC-type cobalt transport system substrate-binding protein